MGRNSQAKELAKISGVSSDYLRQARYVLHQFKGHRYLDIRVYTDIEGKADRVPTKKGVTLRPDLIPELIKALENAQ